MDENFLRGYQPCTYVTTLNLSSWNTRIVFTSFLVTDLQPSSQEKGR